MARYSEDDKAQALAILDACDGNVSQACRESGVPRKTLEEWRNGRVAEPVAKLRQQKKGELADELERIAWKLTGAMEAKIDDASLKDTATSLGITVDKMRLLREQSTAIVKDDSLTDSDRAGRIAELLDRGRARRDGRAIGESPAVH